MAIDSERLAISRLKWLGVHSSDYGIDGAVVLPSSYADRVKMQQLLGRSWLEEQNDGARWRSELERMSLTNNKAEIEIMSDSSGGIVQYVRSKIDNQAWL